MFLFKVIRPFFASACVLSSATVATADGAVATGVVFIDTNGNHTRDTHETGLAGVGVSNGRDVVQTDAEGRYNLTVDDDSIVFVIKPSGYRTVTDRDHLARFYYIHKPAGSPRNLGFPGVEPTGPLPAEIHFPLYPVKESEAFDVIFFGDPQPRGPQEHARSCGHCPPRWSADGRRCERSGSPRRWSSPTRGRTGTAAT